MLCICLVSVWIGEMYTFRLVGGPVVTICIGGIVIETAKFNILFVGMSNQV